MNSLLIIFCAAGIIILIYSLKKVKLSNFFASALTGIACLATADFIGSFFNFNLELNIFSGVVSALGGLPGVILLTVLKTLLG